MFWKKLPKENSIEEIERHSYRFCYLYISEKYNQIVFVPFGKANNNVAKIYAELDSIITDKWPCDFGTLQQNIEATLDKFSKLSDYKFGNWPSFNNSKAKTQQSFASDYVQFRLETDKSKPYGSHEVERIKVTASPTSLDNNYNLIGCDHLLDTKIAQIVDDIFNACLKIRNY